MFGGNKLLSVIKFILVYKLQIFKRGIFFSLVQSKFTNFGENFIGFGEVAIEKFWVNCGEMIIKNLKISLDLGKSSKVWGRSLDFGKNPEISLI